MGWVLSRRWESATHAARPTKLRFYVEIAGSRVTKAHRAHRAHRVNRALGRSGLPSVNHYKCQSATAAPASLFITRTCICVYLSIYTCARTFKAEVGVSASLSSLSCQFSSVGSRCSRPPAPLSNSWTNGFVETTKSSRPFVRPSVRSLAARRLEPRRLVVAEMGLILPQCT